MSDTDQLDSDSTNPITIQVPLFTKKLERHAGFSDLPGEVRNKIYNLVLETSTLIELNVYSGGRFRTHNEEKDANFCPQLLRVCRQIYFETRTLLIPKNKFSILTRDTGHRSIPQDILAMVPFIGHLVNQVRCGFGTGLKQCDAIKLVLTQMTGLQSCNFEFLRGVLEIHRELYAVRQMLRHVLETHSHTQITVKHASFEPRTISNSGWPDHPYLPVSTSMLQAAMPSRSFSCGNCAPCNCLRSLKAIIDEINKGTSQYMSCRNA